MTKHSVIPALCLGVLMLAIGATMAKADEFVCSPMSGRLVDTGGAPVAGVTVRRLWSWQRKTGEDETTTDGNGAFTFDAVPARRGFFGSRLSEDAVAQRYVAMMPEGEVEFLFVTRLGLDLNGETNGAAFNVRCTLGAEANYDGVHFGSCQLDN